MVFNKHFLMKFNKQRDTRLQKLGVMWVVELLGSVVAMCGVVMDCGEVVGWWSEVWCGEVV